MVASAGGAEAPARFRPADADLRAVVFLALVFGVALLAVVFRVVVVVLVAVVLRALLAADLRVPVLAEAAVLRVVVVFAADFRAGAFALAVVLRVLAFAGAALRVLELFAAVFRVPDAAADFLVADLAVVLRVLPALGVVLRAALLAGAFAVFRLLARTAMAWALGCSGVVSFVLTSGISFVPILFIAARIEGRQPRARGKACCSR